MLWRDSRTVDRGISVVLGMVLLVGIVTITMALLATAVLGVDFLDQAPSADIVYEEDGNGTVLIALADARGLSADDTDIRLQNEGDCATWDGSGTLEKGDTMVLDASDCPKSLEEGDVLQVIGSDVLVDTYELNGVGAGFDICEDAIEKGELTVNSGETYECSLVGEDGGRVGVDLEMYGGELDGDANLSADGDLDLHGGTIDGDVESERFSLETEWTITGDLTVPETAASSSVDLKRDTTVEGRILSDERTITLTDATVGDDVEVTGTGELIDLAGSSSIAGDIIGHGNTVNLEPDTWVDGAVTAGDVTLKDRATIRDDVDANTVALKINAVIEGDVAAEEVSLKRDAAIEGDVTEGDIVECGENAEINGEPCDEHENYTGG